LLAADDILTNSDYQKLRDERYSSFDSGPGKLFEEGKLTLEDLREIAIKNGEPQKISGKQELFETLLNMYL
jgi:xylose isomerase